MISWYKAISIDYYLLIFFKQPKIKVSYYLKSYKPVCPTSDTLPRFAWIRLKLFKPI